jgi:hypothetical protein
MTQVQYPVDVAMTGNFDVRVRVTCMKNQRNILYFALANAKPGSDALAAYANLVRYPCPRPNLTMLYFANPIPGFQ